MADDKTIHMFTFPTKHISEVLIPSRDGFSLRFSSKHLAKLSENPIVDYCCWREERLLSGFSCSQTPGDLPNIQEAEK